MLDRNALALTGWGFSFLPPNGPTGSDRTDGTPLTDWFLVRLGLWPHRGRFNIVHWFITMYSVVYGINVISLDSNVGGGRDYDTLDAAQRCFDDISQTMHHSRHHL